MRVTAILVASALAAHASTLEARPNCNKGKPCGDACIAANKTCHIGTYSPAETKRNPGPRDKHARSEADVADGFLKAADAVDDCRQIASTSPDGRVEVEVWIGGDGLVMSANPTGSNGHDQVGWCVAKAVTAHASFVPSKAENEKVTYTFDVPPLYTPPAVEPEPTPPPAPKLCRRGDFADFDAFVECRVEQGPQPKAKPPAAPPAATSYQEARDAFGHEESERDAAADDAAEARITRRTVLGLGIAGGVIAVAGLGLVIAGVATGTSYSVTPAPPPANCMVGKPCGSVCIQVTDVCHTPTPGEDDGSRFQGNTVLTAPGAVALLAGTGMLIAALVINARARPKTRAHVFVTGVGIGIRL